MRRGVRKTKLTAGRELTTDQSESTSSDGSGAITLTGLGGTTGEGSVSGQGNGSLSGRAITGFEAGTDRVYPQCGGSDGSGDDESSIERSDDNRGERSFRERSGSSSSTGTSKGDASTWIFAPVTEEEELEITDCPGGICPVPWATDTSGDHLSEDIVNSPSHYTDGAIECIEAIEAQLTPEEYRGYLKGNCAKYIWREKHKGGSESLMKAQWYLNRLIALDN